MSMPRSAIVALWCAAVLACAPAASAAVLTVGSGKQPDVVIDSNDTTHIVWNTGDGKGVNYCALGVGSGTCTVRPLGPLSDDAFARPYVFSVGPNVGVLTRRCCAGGAHAILFTSGNGGQDFGPPAPVGTLNPSGDAAFGPGAGISMVTDSLINTYFQRVPADGSAAVTAEVPLSSQYTYHGAVTVTGGRPLAAFDNLSDTAFTYADGGDPNSGASWPLPVVVGAGVEPHLATGPSGTYLLTKLTLPYDEFRLDVRKFNDPSFGPPHTARDSLPLNNGGSIGAAAIAEDAAGRLHVVWREGGGNPTKLMYTGSSDGVNWSAPRQVAQDVSIQDLRLSVGAGGAGVAVWDNGAAGLIKAAGVPPPLPPVAHFTYAPHGICTGPVQLDASSSAPGLGGAPIVNYHWQIYDERADEHHRLVPFVSDFYTGTDPLAHAVFQWVLYRRADGDDLKFTRPPVFVRLTVIDANGLSTSVEDLVSFLHMYPETNDLRKLDPPCPHLDPSIPARLASPVARVGAGGTLSVFLRCPNAGLTCLGTIQLSQVRAGSSRRRRRAAPAVLGKRLYVVPEGKRGRIKVKLNRRGRALLRRGRLRRVRAVLSTHLLGSTAKNRVTILRVKR
jgi:hypothetical protein